MRATAIDADLVNRIKGPFDPYPQVKGRQVLGFASFMKRKTRGAVIQTAGMDAD